MTEQQQESEFFSQSDSIDQTTLRKTILEFKLPTATERLQEPKEKQLIRNIKENLTGMLEGFMYEQNDKECREQVRESIETYFKGLMDRNKLYDYIVLCDETNNKDVDIENNVINVDLVIKTEEGGTFYYVPSCLRSS